MNCKITTLIENNLDDNNLLISEHGLSLFIEIDGTKILFDTGKTGNFTKNAETLNIDLSALEYAILSHGHYDHSGGFRRLVEKIGNSFKLVIGEEFFKKKYKLIDDTTYKYNGNPFDKEFIKKNNISTKYIKDDIFYINENILLFSNFQRTNDFEIVNNKFHIKNEHNYIIDNFSDEIVLAVKAHKGLIVFVGCSHIGVVNILETIIKRTGMPIYGVIGGTHLVEADNIRLENTIEFFKENDIRILALSHCTGDFAIEEIKREFGSSFIYNNTGNVIEIQG